MENYYAKSLFIGRKSSGSFFGLQFKNASKDYRIQIFAVTWQVWAVDIYEGDDFQVRIMLHQTGEALPTFEIRNTTAYKHGYRCIFDGAEIYTN